MYISCNSPGIKEVHGNYILPIDEFWCLRKYTTYDIVFLEEFTEYLNVNFMNKRKFAKSRLPFEAQ